MRNRIVILSICLACFIGSASGQYIKRGFWGGFEFDYGLSLSDKGDDFSHHFGGNARMQMVGLRTVFGYYVTPSFSIGTGIGLSSFSKPRNNMVPVFLDLRYHPITRINENLYLNFNLGTALANNQSDLNTRLFWELALGYKLFDFGPFTLEPAVGFNFMKYDKEVWNSHVETYHDRTQKRRTLFFRLSLTY